MEQLEMVRLLHLGVAQNLGRQAAKTVVTLEVKV